MARGGGGAAFDEFAEEKGKLEAEEKELDSKKKLLERQAHEAETKGRRMREEATNIDESLREVGVANKHGGGWL